VTSVPITGGRCAKIVSGAQRATGKPQWQAEIETKILTFVRRVLRA
jgi:hypothetical protein